MEVELVNQLLKGVRRLGEFGPVPDTPAPTEDSEDESGGYCMNDLSSSFSVMDALSPRSSAATPVFQDREFLLAHKNNITMQALAVYKQYQHMQKSDWKPFSYPKSAPGISAYELLMSTDIGSRAIGTVTGSHSADTIARRHMDANKITRLCWDSDISDIGQLEDVNSNPNLGITLTVQWTLARRFFPGMGTRERVYLQWARRNDSKNDAHDGSWIIICASTKHKDRPEQPNLYSRDLFFHAMVLEPLTLGKDAESILPVHRISVTLISWGVNVDTPIVLAEHIRFLRTVKYTK